MIKAKLLLTTFFIIAFSGSIFSQSQSIGSNAEPKLGEGKSTYLKCKSFSISRPLRDLALGNITSAERKRELPMQVGGNNVPPRLNVQNSLPDPVVQSEQGGTPLDTVLVSFEGGSYYRPDATGAAGPDNYVQAVNLCNIKIFDKAGNLQLSTDMTALGGGCSDDPIVLYDKFADRWLITDVSDGTLDLTVAISKTPDPLGQYYIYKYAFTVMPDFPKYSIWSDGYYVSFRNINSDTVGIGVFERDRMLKGDAGAGLILCKFPNGNIINAQTQLPGCPKILSSDGALPAFGKPNYLMYFTNTSCGDATNSIMIYKMKTDTTLKKCVFTFDTALATTAFNAYFYGYGVTSAIAEPGNFYVWSLDGTFQNRVAYMRFTGYNSAVLCNTVNLGSYRAGVRWYELRQNDTTEKWSIYQQSTFGPNDGINRWNSSVAMNLNGDISIAYNVSNSTSLYPGIRYTGRLAGDPLNQMTFAEQTAAVGLASYNEQWGDYCQSTLDPDGITFWHTSQYMKTQGADPNTRIFAYRLSTTATDVPATTADKIDFTVFNQGNDLNVHVAGLASNDPVVMNLFDVAGKQLSSEWITPAAHRFESRIKLNNSAGGTYLVRIGNEKFTRVAKVFVK